MLLYFILNIQEVLLFLLVVFNPPCEKFENHIITNMRRYLAYKTENPHYLVYKTESNTRITLFGN